MQAVKRLSFTGFGVPVGVVRGTLGMIMACSLAACASSSSKESVAVNTQAAAFPTAQGVGVVGDYYIHPGDMIQIRFEATPELNDTVKVQPDGLISLRLVNEITTAGKTTRMLREELARAYSEQGVREPHITVTLQTAALHMYVDGQVTTPKEIVTDSPLTLRMALASAGGVKPTARTSKVVIIRRGPPDKAPTAIPVDYHDLLKNRDSIGDIVLADYDVVYVPQTAIGDFDQFINQYIRGAIPVTLTYGFGTYSSSAAVSPGTGAGP